MQQTRTHVRCCAIRCTNRPPSSTSSLFQFPLALGPLFDDYPVRLCSVDHLRSLPAKKKEKKSCRRTPTRRLFLNSGCVAPQCPAHWRSTVPGSRPHRQSLSPLSGFHVLPMSIAVHTGAVSPALLLSLLPRQRPRSDRVSLMNWLRRSALHDTAST